MAVIDELERMQVFYVNIGGGEPTVRRDFWELVDYATSHRVGVKFSTNGSRITAERGRAPRRRRLRRRAGLARRRHAGGQRRDPRRGLVRHGASRAMEHLANAGFKKFKLSVVVTRENVVAARRVQGARRSLRRAAAAHAPAPLGARRRRVGPAASDRAISSATLYDWLLAHGDDVLTGDSFFHLSALRRAAARAEPVRRRTRGVPDRPDRRRVRLPVRDPRRVPRGQRSRRRRLRARLARVGAVRRTCAARRAPARARAAGCSTRVAAAAWRRSSSPGCRSTVPIRSACSATANGCSRPRGPIAAAVGRPLAQAPTRPASRDERSR